jgi:predicted dehydrogenase
MGASHVSAFQQNPHCEVRVLCDIDTERAEEVAKQERVPKTTACFEDALAEGIDIVSIATPDQLHRDQCVAAARAGKHVFCEKPLALTMADCNAIIDAVDESGVLFMVGQVCRFAPAFVLTKSLIEDGIVGNLFLVESEYAHNYSRVRGMNDWRLHPDRHPFIGGACHAVDLVRWIAGNVEEVHAYSNHFCLTDWPNDDCTVANLRFESGVIGKVMCSIGCRRPYTMRSCFYGTEGTIISTNTESAIQVYSNRYPTRDAFWEIPVELASHNVKSEVDEFVDCVLNGRMPVCDAREATRTVATCLAAVESAEHGQPVKLSG